MDMWILWTAIWVLILLFAEWRQSTRLRWVAKPLASLGFLMAGIQSGGAADGAGQAVLAAFLLSFLGDVLLIPKASTAFLLGIVSFLLGHVAFIVAFARWGIAPGAAALTALGVGAVAVAVTRWLIPKTPSKFKLPVLAYVSVISVMVACAGGSLQNAPSGLALAAAIAFFLSDLSVAIDRFVARSFVNRAWGLPLYYGAQILFALAIKK